MRLIYKLILITLILISLFGQINKPSQAQTIYVYVNHCREGEEPQDGSPAHPYATLTRAVAAAVPGSTLLVQAGNYSEAEAFPLLISKRLTIRAWNGPVEVGSPSRTQKIGCTKRIAQLTGDYDPEGKPHTNNTIPWKVPGVDLGANTEHNGRIYIYFGDVPSPTGSIHPPADSDLVAFCEKNQNPENGLALKHVPDVPNAPFYPFQVQSADGSVTHLKIGETPTGAFSYDGKIYVFAVQSEVRVVPTDEGPKEHSFPYSSLTYSPTPDQSKPYQRLFFVSDSTGKYRPDSAKKFFQVAPMVIKNADLPGLPQTDAEDGLILFGHGEGTLEGACNVYPAQGMGINLAWMPLRKNQFPNPSEIRYYKGHEEGTRKILWSAPGLGYEKEARTLFRTRWWWTSISVGRMPETGKWILLYQRTWREDDPSKKQELEESIVARIGAAPWDFEDQCDGKEIPIFTPAQDGAYRDVMNRGYMHRGWGADGLETLPPVILNEKKVVLPGFAYGAHLLNPYTRWDAATRTLTIYYLMSTGAPYQVQLMRSKIKVNP